MWNSGVESKGGARAHTVVRVGKGSEETTLKARSGCVNQESGPGIGSNDRASD